MSDRIDIFDRFVKDPVLIFSLRFAYLVKQGPHLCDVVNEDIFKVWRFEQIFEVFPLGFRSYCSSDFISAFQKLFDKVAEGSICIHDLDPTLTRR